MLSTVKRRIFSDAFLKQFAVYGIVPLVGLLLSGLIVLLQFFNSRLVFPEESLPLYRRLSAVAQAHRTLPQEEEEDQGAILLSHMDLSTEAIWAVEHLPQGVFPIVQTTISSGSGLINTTGKEADHTVMASAYPVSATQEGPTVLVLHSHATESYYDPSSSPVSGIVLEHGDEVFGYYEQGESPRSEDDAQNVVAVGRVFCDTLEEMGIGTVHCTTHHDSDFNKSYGASLNTMQEYLKKYPTIRYIIDLHRDSLVREGGTKLKPTVTIEGESVAQVMLVVGTGSASAAHPNWRDNLAMGARYVSYLSSVSPEFARPIYLRSGCFNQHLTAGSMLLEVGSCGNTLQEALRAGKYAARALGTMILEAA